MFEIPLENITDELLLNAHPGTAIRLDYLPDLRITEYRLAKMLGISQTHVRQILRAERSITAPVALRLGRLFNQSPDLWMHLQADYDVLKARRQLAGEIEKIEPLPVAA